MKLLLHRSLHIDRHTLERIMQAILFYAESVSIRAAATASDEDRRVTRRINELVDLGAIGTWSHEYELDRRERPVRGGPGHILPGRAPDQVIAVETARDLIREVDDELARLRAPAESRPKSLRQGVAEVVQFRHSMSVLRLTDHLGANGVMTASQDRSHLLTTIERATTATDRREKIVRELVSRCSFGSLSDLPLEAIVDCRRETSRFGALLEQHIAGSTPEAPAVDLAKAILSEYQRVKGARPGAPRDPAGTPTWDIVGAVLPSAVVVKAMGTRIEWFRHRRAARPFVLLGKLKHHVLEI